ncbi:hypothetical protein MIR68_003333 [Amoeboaphelidium protococcarum]|nr:hypothetical protein MIR68_003333 [Amoeboaphelidium protococcarum]KAI3654159.1 hypothetical protein MP228_000878 [Amoeboaphelidium protococcarum]
MDSIPENQPSAGGKASLNASVRNAPNQAKGRLFIRIVEAKNLAVKRAAPRPYCVVSFEGNEFITKEATSLNAEIDNTESHKAHQGRTPNHDNQKTSTGIKVAPLWKHEAVFDVTRPDGEVILTIYDKMPHTGQPGQKGQKSNDQFLGYVKIRPPRMDNKVTDNWFRLLPRQWKEKVFGDLHIQLVFKAGEQKALTPDDFELLKVLGKGSFGKVLQVRKRDTNRIYAMKVLYKKDIIERQEVEHTMSERHILKLTNHPFLVGLKFAFQTQDKLYLVLDFMNGGELFYHLQQSGRFDEERAQFYGAEILLSLDHLHKQNVIYRDLKPENILLDYNGHVALTDFGLCKENMTTDSLTKTFCGTAEYLAPEILLGQGYGRAVDWWSLGILLYEMMHGVPPFYADNHHAMYRKILYSDLVFPDNFSPLAKSLITALLDRDPKTRLGSGPTDGEEIKKHPFFKNINWDNLYKKQMAPPFKPQVDSEHDVSNFDPAFTDQDVTLKTGKTPNVDGSVLSGSGGNGIDPAQFQGFTFNQDSELRHGSYRPAI